MSSQWIWPFELKDKLGEGGMGVVYRARYVGNDRIVAVKLLPSDVAANENLVLRFERELEILQQLEHPHIVRCFGGVCESKQRFYAMELVEGGTLADLLRKKRRFSWDRVIEYALQMCAALQYAHERNVIHRDVKPGNFLVTKSGQLKLSDFGLATMTAAARITTAGRTAGTFHYMAPEQIRGQPPVSNRTDLYALGCVLLELLTGRPPFDAETPAAILHQHLKAPPPRLAQLLLDCPEELDQLVADLLEKDPDRRPASAQVVAHRLEVILHPSRKQIDPYAKTPAASIAPVVVSKDSDGAIPVKVPRTPLPWRWGIITVLLGALAAFGLAQAARARQAADYWEQRWIAQLARTDSGFRSLALSELAQAGSFSPEARTAVWRLVQDPEPTVRTEALQTLKVRPEGFREKLPELMKLQREDASDSVRSAAEGAIQAIRQAPDPPGFLQRNGWFIGGGFLIAVAFGVDWLRKRWKPR
jgi:serine/threonine protein kinase